MKLNRLFIHAKHGTGRVVGLFVRVEDFLHRG